VSFRFSAMQCGSRLRETAKLIVGPGNNPSSMSGGERAFAARRSAQDATVVPLAPARLTRQRASLRLTCRFYQRIGTTPPTYSAH
jgi:hypothetical protein